MSKLDSYKPLLKSGAHRERRLLRLNRKGNLLLCTQIPLGYFCELLEAAIALDDIRGDANQSGDPFGEAMMHTFYEQLIAVGITAEQAGSDLICGWGNVSLVYSFDELFTNNTIKTAEVIICDLAQLAVDMVRRVAREPASSPSSHSNELSEQDPTPSPSEGDPPLESMPDGYDHPDCMPPALMGLKWECDSCGKPWRTLANGQPIGVCQCGSTSARFVELVCIDDPIAGEGDGT